MWFVHLNQACMGMPANFTRLFNDCFPSHFFPNWMGVAIGNINCWKSHLANIVESQWLVPITPLLTCMLFTERRISLLASWLELLPSCPSLFISIWRGSGRLWETSCEATNCSHLASSALNCFECWSPEALTVCSSCGLLSRLDSARTRACGMSARTAWRTLVV